MYQNTILEFLNIGGGEMMLIALAILLLFGGKKLPELARGLGKGIREFKDASEGVKREIHRNINAVTSENEEQKEEENHALRHHPIEDETSIETSSKEDENKTTEEEINIESKRNEINS